MRLLYSSIAPVVFVALLCLSIPRTEAADNLLPDAAAVQVTYAADAGGGIGGELAWDAGEQWRVRLGVGHYTGQREHLVSLIRFTEKQQRTDAGLFIERKLTRNGGWYAVAGAVHPGQGARWDAEPDTRFAYTLNDKQYAGIHLTEPEGRVEYASLAPYAGLGWRSRPRHQWQVSAEAGLVSGLDPTFAIHTSNPFKLPYLEQDLQVEADKYIARQKADGIFPHGSQLRANISLSYHF